MVSEYRHAPEPDLDRTDRLPMLPGTVVAADVADDAVPLGPPTGAASPSPAVPSVAQGVRSGHERIERPRIERPNADFEALTAAYDRARQAESSARERAAALAVELAAASTLLQAEQARSKDLERLVAERDSALASLRSRIEEYVREAERQQSESRTLRESLAARDAAVAQALHALGERDAQLSALQREHAKIVPVLEATSQSTSQLEAELQGMRADANSLAAQLQESRQTAAALSEHRKRSESDMAVLRSDWAAARAQASSYLDLLRTREWRRGFVLNLIRDQEAAAAAPHENAKPEARVIGEPQAEPRGEPPVETRSEAQPVTRLPEAEQQLVTEQAAEIARLRTDRAAHRKLLQSEAEKHEQEIAVLMAHLQEARRPIQSIEADVKRLEADVKRLTEESAAKSGAIGAYEEENRGLRSTLERTRGALEERELLIRRLERSETSTATGLEWQGSPAAGSEAGAAPAPEWSAELVRIDDDRAVTYVLAPRTRIGRAVGCELHLDASSVSRHHALVLVGPRETIIEDLNSTNGILVNGRKVTHQVLCDRDTVTIGEVHFRFVARSLRRPQEPALGDRAPAESAS